MNKNRSEKDDDKRANLTLWKALKKPLLIFFFVLINILVIAITAISEFGNSKMLLNFPKSKSTGGS